MRCEAPGCLNQAIVHFTQLEGGKKVEIHLCEKCAEKQGVTTPPKHLALQQILESLEVGGKSESEADKKGACPRCGLVFSEFRSSGRLGCSHDYTVFRDALERLIGRIHDADQHRGKVPSRAGELTVRRQQVQGLSDELQSAIDSENYERAAELRDQIRVIEEGRP